MPPKPTVAVFGSCRVVAPLVQLHKLGEVRLVNEDNLWYTHSPMETVQKIKMLKGGIALPASLYPFVVDAHPADFQKACPTYFDEADIGVVEISTAKMLKHEQCYLHLASVCKFIESGKNVPPHIEYFADNAEFVEAVGHIKETFRRVLFVGLITYAADLKTHIRGRELLNAFVKSQCDGRDSLFFDPVPLIATHGPATMLSDHNHYASAAFPPLRRAIKEQLDVLMGV